ncbi:hypothetical protein VC83_03949 [Pseudogymnoascus destructans]|uniref:Uncharacterized protein n=1 Tax=Pseudogymnoascus destructans TaxID=655981 RepID=A0A177ACX9_9PEZI|nr:uncharacterized protein VC83_03949 [Pseudogymnoascus destructans]OAF59660.1 hypothetical protein VC83_03949 [Pseudogymnoascus destructans]
MYIQASQDSTIDLENEVNNSGNFISETTHVGAAEHGIDERSPVAPESRDYDNGTDQEPAIKATTPIATENDSSSEDDDEDDADYELNETRKTATSHHLPRHAIQKNGQFKASVVTRLSIQKCSFQYISPKSIFGTSPFSKACILQKPESNHATWSENLNQSKPQGQDIPKTTTGNCSN